ncbi:MAG: hypothetical protein QM784_20345 [Polyangiaceae bacterium]
MTPSAQAGNIGSSGVTAGRDEHDVAGAGGGTGTMHTNAADGGSDSVGGGTSNGKGEVAGCVSQLRANVERIITASSCPDVCPMTVVVPRVGLPRMESQGQRILLVDDGIVFAAATRYRSRTLAFLKAETDGDYHAYLPSFEMPREAYDVLTAVDDASRYVRGSELELAEPFANKFASRLSETWLGHGSDILAFLAEELPEVQFVVSESKLELDSICDVLEEETTENGWVALEQHFAAMQRSIIDAILRYGVNYVHLSWGLEHDGLVKDFERDCGQTPSRAVTTRILRLYIDLFESITAQTTPGAHGRPQSVVIFQAGASATTPEDFILDCADIPGRMRVYSSSYTGYGVPIGGSHDYALLRPRELAAKGCNDLYVVMGYDDILGAPRPRSFRSLTFGLGPAPRPAWPPAPSFANPVGLAHFIHLSLQYPEETPAWWMSRLTDTWSKPIVDPLLYRQFPSSTYRYECDSVP